MPVGHPADEDADPVGSDCPHCQQLVTEMAELQCIASSDRADLIEKGDALVERLEGGPRCGCGDWACRRCQWDNENDRLIIEWRELIK